jgi:uncharacterized membrane protein YczE
MSNHFFLKTIPRSGSDFLRFVFLIFGFFIYSFGIVLMIKSSLGASPWDVFHLGLTNYTPLTLGQVGQVVGIVLIFISWYLGVKPGLGTICNMFFIGLFIDLLLGFVPLSQPGGLPERIFCFVSGMVIVSIATVICIITDFGTGPRDSLMLGLNSRFGIRLGLARGIIELAVVIAGTLLKGGPGIGTLLFTVAIGPLVELFLPLLKKITDFSGLTGVSEQQL